MRNYGHSENRAAHVARVEVEKLKNAVVPREIEAVFPGECEDGSPGRETAETSPSNRIQSKETEETQDVLDFIMGNRGA